MPKRKRSRRIRKRRTREHVIADLGAHHVEGFILRRGFTAERVAHDYGVDLYMTTYTEDGQIENDLVFLQVKSTDHPVQATDGAITFRLARADLVWWLAETFPVILVLYDARNDRGYWLYVQEHFERLGGLPANVSESVTVHLPMGRIIDVDAIARFATAKAGVQAQLKGIRHHE